MGVLYAYAAPVEGDAIAERLGETLCVGVGKVPAAVALTERLLRTPLPDACVLFGLCGAYHSLKVGDLCVIAKDILIDEGVQTEEGFLLVGEQQRFVMDPARSQAVAERLGIPIVSGTTVSTCSGSNALSTDNASRSGATVESMEGAAAAFACEQRRIPFVQVRCVSNRTGDRRESGWDLEGSIAGLQDAILRLHLGGFA